MHHLHSAANTAGNTQVTDVEDINKHFGLPAHTRSHLQVTQCFRGQLQGGKGSTYALVAQGFALCGHDPEPWLVDELIAVSSTRLPRMDMSDLITLAEVSHDVDLSSVKGNNVISCPMLFTWLA